MKSLFCSIIGFFLVSATYGQSLWEAGYFIDNNGKKTEALIKKRLWRDNPTEFEWKKTISSSPRTAKIEDIKEFAVGEDYLYKRYILKFDLKGDTVGRATKSENPELKIRKIFLRLIVRSKTSLYQYSEGGVHRFFYTNPKDVYPELLVYKVYYTPDESKDLGEKVIPKENTKFREQLADFASCGKLDPSKLEYTQTDLKRYFVQYNECKGNKILYIIRKKINQTRVGIVAAADLTNFEHLTPPEQGARNVMYPETIVPRYGIFIESFIPFSKVDLSFFLEATYKNYTTEGRVTDVEGLTYALDYTNINVALAPRIHIYLSPKFELFLEGGISVDFDFDTESEAIDDLQNTTTNYFYGGGFGSGRFKIGYRMYTTKNISKDNAIRDTAMEVSSLYLSINIFGHKNRGD